MEEKRKKGAAAIRMTAILMMIIFPILLFISIVHFLSTSVNFYLEVLKGSYFIRAFVEGRNDEMNRRIRDEIEEKVRLDEFAVIAQRSKEKHEREKERFEKINKTKEYLLFEKQLKEIKKISYEDSGRSFANEKAFEEFREKEVIRLKKSLSEIESYRESHEKEIERAEEDLESARRDMERAIEALQEKNEEAQEIIEKHKGTFAARINEDIRLIMPVLEPIFNEKIIGGTVRKGIENLLSFLADYPRQKILRNVYYEKEEDGETSLRIRLPRMTFSLWVDDGGSKRHILSDVFVEEVAKVEGLRNRLMFTTMFRLSDTVIAEYLANRLLRSAGVTIREGIISMPPMVIEGETAEVFQKLMLFATYGGFVKYFSGALLAVFILSLIFSKIERQNKFLWLKRILLWPSLVMVILSIGLIFGSRFIFEIFPYIFPDAMLVGFAKNIAYSLAWCVALPIGGVFVVIGAIGYLVTAGGTHR